MNQNEFPEVDIEYIHWMTLFLGLIDGGVRVAFPTTDASRDRLTKVRWPNKVTCPKCNAQNNGYLKLRKVFFCRDCLHQFSATSGTFMHGRRIDLFTCFIAAENIIAMHAAGIQHSHLTGHAFKDRLGISYAAAFRLKSDLIADLLQAGGGLFGHCICT